jgi:hypothetical protein
MATFTIKYTHLVENTMIATVEADSEAEALEKAKQGMIEDEEIEDTQGIECKNFEIVGEE